MARRRRSGDGEGHLQLHLRRMLKHHGLTAPPARWARRRASCSTPAGQMDEFGAVGSGRQLPALIPS
ncbi:unnamed protein product [Urochloa humidicola]